MEINVEKVFSEQILHTGCDLFNGDVTNLKKLGDFENYIFETEVKGETRILRYVHSSHRSLGHIEAEVDWVEYLHSKGAPVYQHFVSQNGTKIEKLQAQDGTEFFVSCFEKLPGIQVSWKTIEKDSKIAYLWGKAVGHLNRLSKDYVNSTDLSARPQWDEEELFEIERYKPDISNETLIYRDQIINAIKELPKNRDTYGLIHSDLHQGNFLIEDSKIHIFDFDDCSYHWFASDIAMPIYYIVMQRDFFTKENRQAFTQKFIHSFLEGYKSENNFPNDLMTSITLFFRLRDVVLLSVLYKKLDLTACDEHDRIFFDRVKERVETRKTILNTEEILINY